MDFDGHRCTGESVRDAVTSLRHSGARVRTRVYPSSATIVSKSATADLDANPESIVPQEFWDQWIPGSMLRIASE
jgi:hypothetical protein